MSLTGKSSADYIVTGTWSEKAVKEAKKYCNPKVITPKTDSYTGTRRHGALAADGQL